jgi:hypothetical protein
MKVVRVSAVAELGAAEVKTELVRAGLQIDESLEMGFANGPADCGEGIVESGDGERAIEGSLRGLANGSVNEQDLLVDLVRVSL